MDITGSQKETYENENCEQVNLEQEQVVQEEEEEAEQKEEPEYTTIVYQDKVGVGKLFAMATTYLFLMTRLNSSTRRQ